MDLFHVAAQPREPSADDQMQGCGGFADCVSGRKRCYHVWPVACCKHSGALRLNTARASILEGATVTQAATKAGFWHFGRFSQDYRALFGELPSATLQNAR